MIVKDIKNPYIGATCKKGNEIVMEKTPAGFCLGTWDEDGPCCRISSYASTEKGAERLIPDRVSEETIFCNGGCGCCIKKPNSVSEENGDGNEEEMVYYAVVETSAKLVAIPKKLIADISQGLPKNLTAEEIVEDILYAKYKAEEIVLTPDDFEEVRFHKLEDNECGEYDCYSYLLEMKEKAQIIEGLEN